MRVRANTANTASDTRVFASFWLETITAFAPELPRPPEALLRAAGQLERALTWGEFGLRLRRIAAVVVLIGFGWFAHGQVGLGITDSEASPKPPAFVEDALHSHETVLLRARMISQPEVAAYDPTAPAGRLAGSRRPGLPLAAWPQRRGLH